MAARGALLLLSAGVVYAQGGAGGAAQPASPPTAPSAPVASSATPAPSVAPASPPSTANAAAAPPVKAERAELMGAYHQALEQRRLGSMGQLSQDEILERLRESEAFLTTGRTEEAVGRLWALVEHPKFASFANDEVGRAARYLLGEALATLGIYESARAQLRAVVEQPAAWQDAAIYGRRAVRKLSEIAILESASVGTRSLARGLEDLKSVPATAPEDTKGELAYLEGRAAELDRDWPRALAAYGRVTTKSRYWSQATYLAGLIHVEQGRPKEGEDLFCKVADPKRQSRNTTPVLADDRYFAVRDLARLALGRVAHEASRHDDARYYYYLVPKDSDRLSEALYEAATTRYEKKDYDGARELLDELFALKNHNRYEDEALILDAYVDLALCKFFDADKKLRRFIAKYEPIRDAARKLEASDRGMRALLAAAHAGTDAGANDAAASSLSLDGTRAVAALLRVDAAWILVSRRLSVLDREAESLRRTAGDLVDLQAALTPGTGAAKPALRDLGISDAEKAQDVKAAADGLRRAIDELGEQSPKQAEAYRAELRALEANLQGAYRVAALGPPAERVSGKDLPDLLRNDAALAQELAREISNARGELEQAESALAKDALHRLDLRLSRLLRRARLGRIESVLGKKRALEVELEAISAGYLPKDAVDGIQATRYLKDSEEYWPFEGDDWPDEYVGGEKNK
jgi:hypothetical protein